MRSILLCLTLVLFFLSPLRAQNKDSPADTLCGVVIGEHITLQTQVRSLDLQLEGSYGINVRIGPGDEFELGKKYLIVYFVGHMTLDLILIEGVRDDKCRLSSPRVLPNFRDEGDPPKRLRRSVVRT